MSGGMASGDAFMAEIRGSLRAREVAPLRIDPVAREG
jgi:hypothetical protein